MFDESSIQTLLRAIKKYAMVSFDLYDTLVFRNVSRSQDCFQLLEADYAAWKGVDAARGLSARRITAEVRARYEEDSQEITLAQIYDRMDGIGPNDVLWLMEHERALEIKLAVVNQEMIQVFEECKRLGKLIVITSDMYLDRKTIEAILRHCGIEGYDAFYLSSEIGLSKRTGDIFDYLLAQTGLEPRFCLHIGDSVTADYYAPKRKGMASFLVKRTNERIRYLKTIHAQKTVEASIVEALIQNNLSNDVDEYYRFGFSCFGVFLFSYVKWVHSQLEGEALDKVFFLSRDGFIIMQAFQLLYPDEFDIDYLEVSRRSLRVPVFWLDSDFAHFIDSITPSQLVSMKSFMDGLGLDCENHLKVIKAHGLDAESVFDRSNIKRNDRLRQLYDDLLPCAIKQSREEFIALKEYLHCHAVSGRFAVVDIGWSGGMQSNLQKALAACGIEYEIIGLYTGVIPQARYNALRNALDMRGYVFNCLEQGREADTRRFFVGLFEMMFLENDGSVERYWLNDQNGSRAIRRSYEYGEESGNLLEASRIAAIQEGALAFVQKMVDAGVGDYVNFNSNLAFSGFEAVGLHPTRQDIRMFGDFHFYDDGVTGQLANPKNAGFYFTHPAQLKSDFFQSRWKVGFAKRLCYGMPLPYYELLDAMARLKDEK